MIPVVVSGDRNVAGLAPGSDQRRTRVDTGNQQPLSSRRTEERVIGSSVAVIIAGNRNITRLSPLLGRNRRRRTAGKNIERRIRRAPNSEIDGPIAVIIPGCRNVAGLPKRLTVRNAIGRKARPGAGRRLPNDRIDQQLLLILSAGRPRHAIVDAG